MASETDHSKGKGSFVGEDDVLRLTKLIVLHLLILWIK